MSELRIQKANNDRENVDNALFGADTQDPIINKTTSSVCSSTTSNNVCVMSNYEVSGSGFVVQEVAKLRGREVIQQNLGTVGGVCLVVRRPG